MRSQGWGRSLSNTRSWWNSWRELAGELFKSTSAGGSFLYSVEIWHICMVRGSPKNKDIIYIQLTYMKAQIKSWSKVFSLFYKWPLSWDQKYKFKKLRYENYNSLKYLFIGTSNQHLKQRIGNIAYCQDPFQFYLKCLLDDSHHG